MYRYIQLTIAIINKYKKVIFYAILCALLVTLVMFVISLLKACKQEEAEHVNIVLEPTPIEIESVRPKGEIYACSSIMEDYTTFQKTERHLGIIPEKHSCVQILRQKCSYKIDLDKIVYKKDTLNKVFVYMPELEYVATTQNSPFMSDDEEYWIEALPNTNNLKRKVANQIKKRFDTADNRKKAKIYAESAVSALLAKLGYEAEFVSSVEQKRE